MTTEDLQQRLNQGEIIILDGATATEVEKRGVPLHDLTWSAASLLTHPDVVREVHRTYIDAGADIITSNTYATNRNVLAPAGMGDDVQRLNALAVTLAREAREQSAPARPVLIAGSISTESTRPGFYFGRGLLDLKLPTEQQARANYREQAEIMAEAGAELIVLEMMRTSRRPHTPWRPPSQPGFPYGWGSAPGRPATAPGCCCRTAPMTAQHWQMPLRP